MHPNRSNRRVHSPEFKAQILAECRQPGASVSAVAIAHGLNTNVVRKWLTGRGLKRMGVAAPPASGAAPALQFVHVELSRSEHVVAAPASQPDIHIELQRGGLHVKLQCAASAALTTIMGEMQMRAADHQLLRPMALMQIQAADQGAAVMKLLKIEPTSVLTPPSVLKCE